MLPFLCVCVSLHLCMLLCLCGQADVVASYGDLSSGTDSWSGKLARFKKHVKYADAVVERTQVLLPAELYTAASSKLRRVIFAHLSHGHDVHVVPSVAK